MRFLWLANHPTGLVGECPLTQLNWLAKSFRMANVPLKIRFLRHVTPASNGCWLWKGNQASGYGRIYAGPDHRYHTLLAHRVAYQEFIGDVPHNVDVLHTCDVPLCVNPAHLFLGTHKENMADMIAKGRQRLNPAKGVDRHDAKLTENDVREIRLSTDTQAATAAKYGVTRTAISAIRRGKTWKHLK